ncbi:MAG TPA: hypothetical protein VNH64_00530, partial [Parvularculaceae bacterium]|nr:hypothetical protein [Parvularculaceae bacterium]
MDAKSVQMLDGAVIAARGGVIDVRFLEGPLPEIDEGLIVLWDRPEPLVLEVQSHLDAQTVRAIALGAVAGLMRGAPVKRLGGPITVPVGESVLGPPRRLT